MNNQQTNNTNSDSDSTIDSIFDGGEFVFTESTDESTGKKTIIGGGYKINSFFLQGGIPPMTTFNNPEEGRQDGGKVSSPFENLAVPAGLFYISQRTKCNDDDNKRDHSYKQHEALSDDMIDKLFGLVEVDKKRKRKTRKHNEKTDKRKTRRQH